MREGAKGRVCLGYGVRGELGDTSLYVVGQYMTKQSLKESYKLNKISAKEYFSELGRLLKSEYPQKETPSIKESALDFLSGPLFKI